MNRHERRLARFFAILAAIIVLTLIHGCISGELQFHMGKGCIEDYCEPEE